MSIPELAPRCVPLDRTPQGSPSAERVVASRGYAALEPSERAIVDRILCNEADAPALCGQLRALLDSGAFQGLEPASLQGDCLRALAAHPTPETAARLRALVADPVSRHLPADRLAAEMREVAAGPDAPSSRDVLARAGLQGRPGAHGMSASSWATMSAHAAMDLAELAPHLPPLIEAGLASGGAAMSIVVGAECILHANEAHAEGRELGRRIAVANGFVDTFEAVASGVHEPPASLRGLADPEARRAWIDGARQALGVWASLEPAERATLTASPAERAELVRALRTAVEPRVRR